MFLVGPGPRERAVSGGRTPSPRKSLEGEGAELLLDSEQLVLWELGYDVAVAREDEVAPAVPDEQLEVPDSPSVRR